MSSLGDIASVPPVDIWGDAVRARQVQGERVEFSLVELAANAVVPEHRHENEQLGIVVQGTVTFTVDGETRELGPGGTWRIGPNRPHDVLAGPGGAVVIDIFSPTRQDWASLPRLEPRPPAWPRRADDRPR